MVVLIFISLIISDVEHLFHMPVDQLYVFFGKMSIQIRFPFFNQVVCFLILSCISFLCILDISPLSDVSFVGMFSHSVSCLLFSNVIFFLSVIS